MLCYALTANVGIYAAVGTSPVFIKVEDALIRVMKLLGLHILRTEHSLT